MKKDWQIKKLEDISNFRNGVAHEKEIDKQGKYVVVNSKFVSSDGVVRKYTNDFLCPLYKNEIVFVMSDVPKGKTLAKCFIIDEDNTYSLNQRICAFSNIQTDLRFFYYYINRNKYFLNFDNGENQTNLRKNDILKCPFPVPPLEEQKRIVAVLDKEFAQIETLKTAAEKNLQNTKQLFQAELEKAFSNTSCELKELKDVCSYYKKQGKYTNLPYIGMEDIESKTGKFIGSDEIKCVQSSTFAFDNNDVLFGRLRPYLAKVYLAEFSGHCSTEIFPIRTKENLLPAYLKMWLLSEKIINQINDTCTGARMPRADMNAVLSFEIPLPPLEEQKRIVAHLDSLSEKVHQLEEIYTKQLADCDELKQSLLQKAFEGEL